MFGMHAECFSILLGEIDIVLREQIFNKKELPFSYERS